MKGQLMGIYENPIWQFDPKKPGFFVILFIQAIWRREAFGTQVKARAFLGDWLH